MTIAATTEASPSGLSPSQTICNSTHSTNGLKLSVWPELVGGLTYKMGNFTIQITKSDCDLEDYWAGSIGEDVQLIYKEETHIMDSLRFWLQVATVYQGK